MTFTRVQATVQTPVFSGTPAISFSSTPTQNNLLVAWFSASQTLLTLANTGWTPAVTALQAVGGGVYYKIAGASEPSTLNWSTSGGGSSHVALGVHEYAGNASVPLDNAGFASVYFDPGGLTGPAFSITPGAQHELLFALEAMRYPTAVSTPAGVSWTGGLGDIGDSSDGGDGAGIVVGLAADLLDSGTSLSPVSVAPSWFSPTYKERTTFVLAFMSVAGSGIPVSSADSASGADAGSLVVRLSDGDNVGQVSFDAGEKVFQTGPYPTSDSFSGADAAVVFRADSDVLNGADLGSFIVFSAVVNIFSADSSRKPTTSTVRDTERLVVTDAASAPRASFRSADAMLGTDN